MKREYKIITEGRVEKLQAELNRLAASDWRVSQSNAFDVSGKTKIFTLLEREIPTTKP